MSTIVPFITAHAIERYRERVDSSVSRRQALRAIRAILVGATSRSRPRHWTKVDTRPGCRYLYSAAHADVCLVVRGGAVVTVFSRSSCSSWFPSPDGAPVQRRPVPYRRLRADITEFWEAA
jgi:hypothetical protein